MSETIVKLWYWPPFGGTERSHCAWMIGTTYISAMPVMPAEHSKWDMWYPMQQSRVLADDRRDFGQSVLMVPIKRPLDTAAMVACGTAILRCVPYEPQRFNKSIVAMLVLIAGMPAKDRERVESSYFGYSPKRYRWQYGFSPFVLDSFTEPQEVARFCQRYNTTEYF